MATITEDWGSTLGTAGNYTWSRETAAWFGAGDRYWTAEPTLLREQGASLYRRGAIKCSLSLVNCGTQLHYLNGTNTSFWTRLATAGTIDLWAIVDAWSGAQNEIQIGWSVTNGVGAPSVFAKGTLGAGTLMTDGTLTAWYAGSSWYLAHSCTSNLGSARVGTLQYVTTTYVPTNAVIPCVGLQNLAGTTQLLYSRYWADPATNYGLTIGQGTEYNQIWAPTKATMPSTINFQGLSGVVSRYRAMNGSLHALNAHTEGWKCSCTMYWSQATDAVLAQIGSLSLLGTSEVLISCAWGTFNAMYIPTTFTYSRLLDDINTASISFLEVETT